MANQFLSKSCDDTTRAMQDSRGRLRRILEFLAFGIVVFGGLSSVAMAQVRLIYPNPSFPILPKPTLYRIPNISGDTARFAYIKRSGNTQSLRLAEMLSAHPDPAARTITTLATYDTTGRYPGVSEEIRDLSASPTNQYLLVYALEEGYFPTDSFFDFNFTFYDMIDGTYIGLKNEHSFAALSKATAHSQVYEDYIHSIGLTPANISASDYTVRTEGILETYPDWQWNADGTVTLEMTLDVHEVYADGSMGDFIDEDVFYQTFDFGPSGLIHLGFGPPRAAAAPPATFALTPETGPASRIQFLGKDVRFRFSFTWPSIGGTTYTFYNYADATKVEGNIPGRYRWRYGYR